MKKLIVKQLSDFRRNSPLKPSVIYDSKPFTILALSLLLLSLPLSGFGNCIVQAEDPVIKISGTVSSKDGPMPGVAIYLKGSNMGTITDIDGKFTFPGKLEKNDILVFSFIGYKTIEYKITEDTPSDLDILLEEEAIIVTGALSKNQSPTGLRKVLADLRALLK